jgi:uncharacterized membrane protein YebE (DUF533 family)
MTAIDPNIDATLDPQKQAWKDGESGLDAVNAAPLAPEATRSRFKAWILVAVLVAVCGVGWVIYSKYQAHKAAVNAIKTAPVVLPEISSAKAVAVNPATQKKSNKTATQNIAKETINTPAIPSFEAEKTPIKKQRIDDSFTAEFDKLVLNLESKL